MSTGLRSYEWWDGKLYLNTDYGFCDATIQEAAEELPTQALACLSAKRAQRVHPPNECGAVIMATDSDEDAEWCIDTMRGYDLRNALKWSENAKGGSLFFEEKQ